MLTLASMTAAIIVAAGKGTRMGSNVDKIFIEIHGCPVVGHTWRRFEEAKCVDEIVLVIRAGMDGAFREISQKLQLRKPYRLVEGGKERQDSVWNGIAAVSKDAKVVAIHDAARPCTTQDVIANTVQAAMEFGAAVAAQPLTDTIKESGDGKQILRTLDRSRLWAVQTPQSFRVEVIRAALDEARKRGLNLTDDTAACELIEQPVRLVPSLQPNPKLTRPEDLPVLAALLA